MGKTKQTQSHFFKKRGDVSHCSPVFETLWNTQGLDVNKTLKADSRFDVFRSLVQDDSDAGKKNRSGYCLMKIRCIF